MYRQVELVDRLLFFSNHVPYCLGGARMPGAFDMKGIVVVGRRGYRITDLYRARGFDGQPPRKCFINNVLRDSNAQLFRDPLCTLSLILSSRDLNY